MKRLKFLGGIILILLLCGFLPQVLVRIGWLPKLIEKSWLIIIVTGVALVFKALIGDVVSGEFDFHKFGYENCVMAFGGTLTACVLQLTSKTDNFPGLSFSPLGTFDNIDSDIVNARKVELFILLIIVLLCTLFTANNSRIIKKNETNAKNLLSFLNSIVGLLILATYLYILILKG